MPVTNTTERETNSKKCYDERKDLGSTFDILFVKRRSVRVPIMAMICLRCTDFTVVKNKLTLKFVHQNFFSAHCRKFLSMISSLDIHYDYNVPSLSP